MFRIPFLFACFWFDCCCRSNNSIVGGEIEKENIARIPKSIEVGRARVCQLVVCKTRKKNSIMWQGWEKMSSLDLFLISLPIMDLVRFFMKIFLFIFLLYNTNPSQKVLHKLIESTISATRNLAYHALWDSIPKLLSS